MPQRLPSLLLSCLLLLLPQGAAQAEPGQFCRDAIAAAEQRFGVPARLLSAIARVESGRRDPVTGSVHPWPWTINAEGRGSYYPNKEAAIAAVRSLQATGVRSIDVGCMQVNLRYHPDAFASLEDAFDPATNAAYAASFLAALQRSRGDWERATAAYHSSNPEYGEPYRLRVLAALEQENRLPATARPAGPAAPASPTERALAAQIAVAAGFPVGGRSLDFYRSAPVALASSAMAPARQPAPAAAPLPPAGVGAPAPNAMPLLPMRTAAAAGRSVNEFGGIVGRRLF